MHGVVTMASVSLDPKQYVSPQQRPPVCPICGESCDELSGAAASLHWSLEGGVKYGESVWVHEACFLTCAVTHDAPPIPA